MEEIGALEIHRLSATCQQMLKGYAVHAGETGGTSERQGTFLIQEYGDILTQILFGSTRGAYRFFVDQQHHILPVSFLNDIGLYRRNGKKSIG